MPEEPGFSLSDWLESKIWSGDAEAKYQATVAAREDGLERLQASPNGWAAAANSQIMAQTPSAAGDLWLAWTSGIQGPKLLTAGRFMDHHVFPQQFRKFFQGKGIDIERFTVRVEETMHLKGVHGRGLGNMPGRWNARWSEFINSNPGATAKDIYQFAGRLMDEFGLSGLPIRPYPR